MSNKIIQGENFWISFNPMTDQGAETALCQEVRPKYLILLGDYSNEFKPLVKEGYGACLSKFKQLVKNGVEMSPWSEEIKN
jgi:hypothetical protein